MPLRRYYEDSKREKGLKKSKMLVGGQAKLDKNKNNKIDAEDFKILKAEKAKGRGQGLQDEKMKPGKVKPVKAVLGLAAMGIMGAKALKKKGKAMAIPGIGASAMVAKKQKEMLGRKRGGMSFSEKMKMVKEGKINKKTGKPTSLKALREMKGFKPGETPSQFNQRMDLRKAATKAAKSTRVGKMLLPVVGAAIAAKTYLNSKMKKNKDGTPKKKMGGGMMQRPMAYAQGGPASDEKQRRAGRGQQATRGQGGIGALRKGKTPTLDKKKPAKLMIHFRPRIEEKKGKQYEKNKSYDASPRLISDAKGKTFSMRSMNVGGSVTVKTKIGKYFPTKTY